jgi:hypothetical protein
MDFGTVDGAGIGAAQSIGARERSTFPRSGDGETMLAVQSESPP